MATLECNSTPASFNNSAGQENGEALPEEKSLSIDYSEDLWLANSEDSSGPYAQQQHTTKATTIHDTASSQASAHNSYPNSVSSCHSGEVADSSSVSTVAGGPGGGGSYPVPQHHWGEMPGQNEEEGAHVLQPNATTFLNGAIEQNGMDFHNSSGDEKDFAQLVPAGTYVEAGGGDPQNKTFTALMPAAGLDVNGEEMQPGFTTMLNAAGQQQMVFYGSGEDVNNDSSQMMTAGSHHHQQTLAAYNPSANQMAGVDSQEESQASGEDGAGEGNLYVAMDTADNSHQTVTQGGGGGTEQQFAVMSPAVLGNQVVEGDPNNVKDEENQQGYTTSTVSGSHQAITTLPFLQNGAIPPSSFAQFNQTGTATISGNVVQLSDGTQHQIGSSDVAEYSNHAAQQQQEQYDQDDENSNSQETPEMAAYRLQQEQYQEQVSMEESGQAGGDDSPPKTFICETCQKSFATARYLKYHRKNHCKRAGSYEGKTEQEELMGMEIKRFSCNVCQRPFRVLKCMKVHKKKKHGILKDFTCPNCAISFVTAQELTDHPCQPKSPLPNQEPTATVTSNVVIPVAVGLGPGAGIIHPPPPSTTHFLSAAKKKKKLRHAKPSCDICGKQFGDRISLDIHRVKHIEEEFYPCDMCPLDLHAEDSTHLAVHFRIKFFTDDNQHILEDQKAAAEAMRSDETLQSPNNSIHNHSSSSTPNNSLMVSPHHPHHHPSSSTPIYSNPSSIIATAAACTNIINHSQDGDGTTTTFIDESGAEYSTVIKSEDFQNSSDTTDGQSVMLTPQQSRTFYSEYSSSGGEASQGQVKTPSSVVDDGIPVTKTVLKSKPHRCEVCNKSFTEAAKLEIHYKSNHVEDRPFHCEVCEKSFYTKWKLQRHMLSHLEIKPHSCPACSKSFVERGKLEAHYRTHLGTKPYKCEYCAKAFTVKSQLTIHVRRIHSADQPFGCEICGKAFLWRSGLEKHMRKHTREKPYACQFCGQKYSQKSNLVAHLSKVHNHMYVEQQQQQQQPVKEEDQELQELDQQEEMEEEQEGQHQQVFEQQEFEQQLPEEHESAE